MREYQNWLRDDVPRLELELDKCRRKSYGKHWQSPSNWNKVVMGSIKNSKALAK